MSQNQPDSVRAAQYRRHVKKTAPKSSLVPNCLKAFLVGGLICALGQGLGQIAEGLLGLDKDGRSAFVAVALVFLGTLLTGLGVYDKLGKFAGAGSVVPITGFANSMASPAIEFKHEGLVLGTGAKLFVVAGPVLVYGISSAMALGVVKLVVMLIKGM